VLAGAALGSTAFFSGGMAAIEFFEAVHRYRLTRITSPSFALSTA
jgi:hypothetical protein